MARQIATFLLGDTLFGTDILLVREVYRYKDTSRIPGAPPHLRGLMNLRGRVVTVIDLGVCLNRPPKSDRDQSQMLIFKIRQEIENLQDFKDISLGDDIVGFLIDRMDEVLMVGDEEILPAPPNIADMEESLIDGIIRREHRLVILLNIPAILDQVMAAVAKESA